MTNPTQSNKVYSPEFYALRDRAAKSMILAEEEVKIRKRSRYIVRCLTPHCTTIKESDDGLGFPLYCAACRTKKEAELKKLPNLKLNPVDEARKMRVKYLNDKNNNAERLKEVRIRYQQTDKYKTYQKEYQKNLTKGKNAKLDKKS
jgi:hypothetical protein